MNNNAFMLNLKNFKFPFHLNDDSSATIHFNSSKEITQEFKNFHANNASLEFQVDLTLDSPQLSLTDRSNTSRTGDAPLRSNRGKQPYNQFIDKIMHNYLTEELPFVKSKIKCTSVDRRSLGELAVSYKLEGTLRDMKRICDMNLNILLEDLKRTYLLQKKSLLRPWLVNIGRLVTMFIFSSLSSLRSKKGKYILDKLDELENLIYDHLNIQASEKTSPSLSPIQGSRADVSSLNFYDMTNKAYNPFNTQSAIGNTPRIRRKHIDSFGQIPDPSDKHIYQEILKLIAKVKYTIAQLGHLLHYDRIANPLLAHIKKGDQARQEQTSKHNLYDRASMDLEEDKQVMERSEIFIQEESSNSKNIQDYFYIVQKMMDDFDENVIAKKIESLRRFCVWKAKKWSKREMIEKKYQKMTCKMCESSVKTEKFKAHVELCRKKAELNKRLKDLDNRVSDSIFIAFMEAKTLQKTLVVESKKYAKLKTKTGGLHNHHTHTDSHLNNSISMPVSNLFNNVKGSGKSLEGTPDLHSKGITRSVKKELLRRHSVQMDNKILIRNLIRPGNSLSKASPTEISHPKGSDDNQAFQKDNLETSEKGSQESSLDDKSGFQANRARKQSNAYKNLETKSVMSEKGDISKSRKLSVLTKKFLMLHLEEAEERKDHFSLRPEQEQQYNLNGLEDHQAMSARFASKNGSDGSPSASDSSLNDSQYSDRSLSYSPSPEGLPLTPIYKKSKFHPHNANMEDQENADDESESAKYYDRSDEHKYEKDIVNKSTEDQPKNTCILRRAKTGLEEKPKDEICSDKHDKAFVEDGQVTQAIGQLKKLKEGMDRKKLQIEVYETIQAKAKILVNQEPYIKEMDIIKDDIASTISEMVLEVKNKKVREFAKTFVDVLLERISCGKTIEDTKKKLDQLEGKIPEEPVTKTHERRPSFLRGNSLVFSPTKPAKNYNNSKKRLTEEFFSQKFPFLKSSSLNVNPNKKESVIPTREALKGEANPRDLIRCDTFGDDSPLPEDLDQGQIGSRGLNIEDEPEFFNQIADLGRFNEPILEKGSSWQDGNDIIVRESKEDIILSLWNASLSEVQDVKKQEETEGFDFLESSPKLNPLRDSLSSSISITQSANNRVDSGSINPSITIVNPSTTVLEFPLTKPSPETLQSYGTPDFSNEDNKRFLFAKLEEHDSPITPTFDRSLNKQKASTAPPLKLSEFPQTFSKALGHERSDSKDKISPFKRLDKNGNIIGQSSRPMSPTHEADNTTKIFLKTMLGSSKLFQKLEKKEDYNMNRLPSLCPTPKDSLTHLDQEEDYDENFFTSRKSSQLNVEDDIIFEEPKENLESLSLLESPLYDREYFSDSEAQHHQHSKVVFRTPPPIGIKDFEPLTIISKGAFGRVWLVRKKATKDLYAMKVINLAEKLMKNTELDNLKKENNVFSLVQEDFVVRAVFTFTHETCICFVMEYMIGGDLGDFLFNYNALDEDVARFYIAEIILAVEYLHSLGIVHRDLKPDNILLDKSGHAKLTDFGLSETGLSEKIKIGGQSPERSSPPLFRERLDALKRLYANEHLGDQVNLKVKGKIVEKRRESKDFTSEEEKDTKASDSNDKAKRKGHRLIGTPDYMAPEIISHISTTSYSSDWWSVGVILFEFLVGIAPFNDDTPELIYDNILNLRIPWDQIKIGDGDDCMSMKAADLIKKILTLDHTKRLGANGAKEIKEHPFFEGLNWETLRKQQPPISFDQIQDTDTQNFSRMNDRITEKEKEDPFVLIPKNKDSQGNLQAAIQFIEHSQENFQRVNIPALYSATLQLAEETIKKKEGELKQIQDKKNVQKFNDVFEMPEQ